MTTQLAQPLIAATVGERWELRALCRGRQRLFFASDPFSTTVACSLCRRCPVRLQCAALADDLAGSAYALSGVWAGKRR